MASKSKSARDWIADVWRRMKNNLNSLDDEFETHPLFAPAPPRVARIRLNNAQFRKLRTGQEITYTFGNQTVILHLPTDVRDAIERTS